jgi:hypothetical protein
MIAPMIRRTTCSTVSALANSGSIGTIAYAHTDASMRALNTNSFVVCTTL